MQDSDSQLIQRAKNGEKEAVIEIYRRYQPTIFTYVFYRVEDQELAEDLTSEVFTRLIIRLPSFVCEDRSILAWLYTIAKRLVIDHYRHLTVANTLPLEESWMADDDSCTEKIAEKHISQAWLKRALDCLTEEQRLVILMKFVEDRSNTEVAAILEKTEGAVKTLQQRALAALFRIMQRESFHEF